MFLEHHALVRAGRLFSWGFFLGVFLVPFSAWAERPWVRHTIDQSSRGADGVRLADVNGDGYPDIATGWEEGGLVRVYLHPAPSATKRPWPAVTVGRVASPEDAIFVDLDQDGAVDVVSCCEGDEQTVYVHWAPPGADAYRDAARWSTAAIPCSRGAQKWMFAVALQVDGRQGPDLVVGSKGANASIGYLQAPAHARDLASWRWHHWYSAGWIMSLIAADLDSDGDLDLLASDRRGERRGVLWLENPGAEATRAGRAWPEHRIGGEDREVMFLAHADLLGTGAPQVVAAVRGRGCIVFDRRQDGQWETIEIPLPENVGTGKGVAVGDLNDDGTADLVFTCENAHGSKSGIRSLTRSGLQGNWVDHEISGPTGIKFDRVELLDLDADGDLDVLTCEEGAGLGVVWYENPG